MKDGDTEKPSNTEIRSIGDTQETKETEDVPRLAASVSTLQDAVQISVADGINENSLFTFARALKAFEITQDRRLPAAEVEGAFSLWWATAGPQLPEDADFDEYRLDFLDKFAKTKAPLGSNSLEQAIQRADASPFPEQAARYSSPKIKRLVAVCFHLQMMQGTSPFFLSVRAAAKITQARGLMQASAWLNGLVRDGVLLEVERARASARLASGFMPRNSCLLSTLIR